MALRDLEAAATRAPMSASPAKDYTYQAQRRSRAQQDYRSQPPDEQQP